MREEINAYNNVLELIGNTPLIKLNILTKDFPGSYFTKYEGFNPGHSNKDRIALHIINQAEQRGLLILSLLKKILFKILKFYTAPEL